MSCRRLLLILTIALSVASAAVSITWAQNPAITISINVNSGRHSINPEIYGVAFASSAELTDLNAPLNRSGGNATTQYNWQSNCDNRGADWFFESIAYTNTPGEAGDSFISAARAGGAEPMLTFPMIGWVAKVAADRSKLSSFSIAKYGAQQANDWQWFPDAGNGVRTNGQLITGNDPNDANNPADSTFQQGWAQHLVNRWGTAAAGGLKYYLLDNEPSIWHATHRDVHPTGANMDEMKTKTIDYATKIKAVDPTAVVLGPEEWGWSGYLLSGYDQQWGGLHGWSNLPDRAAHGGWDYLPWLLDQVRQHDTSTGQRLLDVFTVHYYPQGGEFSDDVSSAMQQRRNRSTRSLWDPNYTDETWINDKVKLIPRLKSWVASYYPGTKTGITEYNWGAENHINGATAQADVYGIFGREGLDLGARWTTPAASTPTYKAMKMYRSYDGNRNGFGETSVSCSVPNADNLSSFAAIRSDGALTVMVINKVAGNTPVTMNLGGFAAGGTSQVWQLTSSNTITRLADLTYGGGSIVTSVPGQSITLFVIRGSGATPAFQGFLDASGCGIITGWAWDANQPNTTINVDIYDGSVLMTTIPANLYREDIRNAGIGDGFHGFSFTTPASLKNGVTHSVHVRFAGAATELSSSPRAFNCPNTAVVFQGFHDGAGCGTISGWAWNASDPNNPINVDLYDGATLIATVPAIQFRPDLVTAGIGNGFHGFSFTVPAGMKDGLTHSIRVRFPGTTTDLGRTPRNIMCSGAAPRFEGVHEVADCNTISGWAWDQNDPNSPINVAIFDGSQLLATVLAIQFRQDLVTQGKGNGYHVFIYNVPASLKNGQPHSIRVRFSGTTTSLQSTPRSITCP